MAVRRGRPLRFLAQGARAEGEIGLEPENGPDLLRLGLLVERPGGVHVPVISYRQTVHAQLLDVADQLGNPVGPVEKRVLAMGVEMDEWHINRGS